MFDIGFSELLLVFVIGLIVLGPQRLPVAVKTVMGWMRALRSLASSVQNELAQELKLQELQDSLNKVEKASLDNLTPELKSSMDELRQAAEAMRRSYQLPDVTKASDMINSIKSPAPPAVSTTDDTATDTTGQNEPELQTIAQQTAHKSEVTDTPVTELPVTTITPSLPDKP